jgi:PAS domain S-box-containing protein
MATYAIARHRLMNMGAAMRHILLHGLLSVVFGCLVFWLLHLNRVLTSGLGEGWGVFVGLVGALSLALLVSPVNAMVTRFVDYQLFEGRYDHRAALMRFGQSLATARSREGVCRVMAREIPIILRVESGAVYVVEEEDEEEGREPQTFALLAQSSGEEPGLPQALNAQQPLAALACAASEPVLRDECQLKPGQGAALVRQFADLHAELAVALRIQGRVRGILLMGEKSSGRVYTSDDLALLGMLLDQAGVALENASLHGRVVDAEQHYETVLQHMQQGVLTVDPRLRVTTLNPSGAEMLGLVPDQAPGRLLADVFPGVLPQVRASLEARQDTPPAEILVSLGGRSVPCEVETSILAGSASRVVGILVVFQDLTERKRFEERMRRMDRLASVGTLAAGVAHEIRNPLVSVKTLVQLLPERCGDPSFQHDFTALVADEVQRMTKLVNDLLEFAGPKRAEREPVDVCGVVAKVLALLEAAMIRGDVEVSLQLAESVPAAFADPGQLHQIFFNLIQNAIQAMEDGGGRITVSLGPGRFLSGESLGQEALVVRVADTGPGLDKENLDRIFDPFFTTKETGTGLGLAICHSMLEEMGALVDVESVPGNGTTFTLTLPTR